MSGALRVELLKLRRSPVAQVATGLMVILIPALALGFFWVAQNGGTGGIALKAQAMIVGTGWEGYLNSVGQIAAAAIFVGSGIVVAWVFGREHADRTFPSLFALPTSRAAIATAKLAVLIGWAFFLAVAVTAVSVMLGVVSALEPTESDLRPGVVTLFVVVLLTSLLATTTSYAASAGRGYLPAIGAVILIVAAAQLSVLFGTGAWFPYAVPGLLVVAGAEGIPEPSALQIALVPALVTAGGWLTIQWWRRAEVA